MIFLATVWTLLTQRGPIVWVRNLFYIVKNYRNDLTMIANGVDGCQERVMIAERYIKRATKVHIDIPASRKNYTKVIIIGTYRGKDHVRIFSLRPDSIDMLTNQMKDLARYADIERIDGPLDVSATMKRSLII